MGKYVFIYRTSSLIIGLLILLLTPRKPLLFVILFYIIFWLKGLFMGTGNLAIIVLSIKLFLLTYGENSLVGGALLTALEGYCVLCWLELF